MAQADFHPDEWKARVELAAVYRIFAMLGWAEMIYNHITTRLHDSISGGEKQFLINPFGLHYSEVTASNLLKIDTLGKYNSAAALTATNATQGASQSIWRSLRPISTDP